MHPVQIEKADTMGFFHNIMMHNPGRRGCIIEGSPISVGINRTTSGKNHPGGCGDGEMPVEEAHFDN